MTIYQALEESVTRPILARCTGVIYGTFGDCPTVYRFEREFHGRTLSRFACGEPVVYENEQWVKLYTGRIYKNWSEQINILTLPV